MYLLDTNVLSELRKVRSGKADARVVAWAQDERIGRCWLSVTNLLEIERGILMLQRSDQQQAAAIRQWMEQWVELRFASRTLPISASIAKLAASFHVPTPMETIDALLAATALSHGFALVTRNTRHFERSGVAMINPWDAAADGG